VSEHLMMSVTSICHPESETKDLPDYFRSGIGYLPDHPLCRVWRFRLTDEDFTVVIAVKQPDCQDTREILRLGLRMTIQKRQARPGPVSRFPLLTRSSFLPGRRVCRVYGESWPLFYVVFSFQHLGRDLPVRHRLELG
jgi:hypothetical protein